MSIGTQDKATKIIKRVGGKAFPNDYNWICSVCGYENRKFENTCQNCEFEAAMNDPELIKASPGTDAGLQSDMFGGVHIAASKPTEAAQEAADIIKRATMYREKYKPWSK